jgi:hypothetical protein
MRIKELEIIKNANLEDRKKRSWSMSRSRQNRRRTQSLRF